MSILQHFKERYEATKEEEYSLEEYLEICKKDRTAYATAAERMLIAIGEPELVDTSRDPRLSRIFSNKVIKRYPEFSEFYGMEDAVENIVSFFRHAAQGLEEKKQILYLLGPVGGGAPLEVGRPHQVLRLVAYVQDPLVHVVRKLVDAQVHHRYVGRALVLRVHVNVRHL